MPTFRYHAFLSHSNRSHALRIHQELAKRDVFTWIDALNDLSLEEGALQHEIAEAHRASRFVVAIVDQRFLDSVWCEAEVSAARASTSAGHLDRLVAVALDLAATAKFVGIVGHDIPVFSSKDIDALAKHLRRPLQLSTSLPPLRKVDDIQELRARIDHLANSVDVHPAVNIAAAFARGNTDVIRWNALARRVDASDIRAFKVYARELMDGIRWLVLSHGVSSTDAGELAYPIGIIAGATAAPAWYSFAAEVAAWHRATAEAILASLPDALPPLDGATLSAFRDAVVRHERAESLMRQRPQLARQILDQNSLAQVFAPEPDFQQLPLSVIRLCDVIEEDAATMLSTTLDMMLMMLQSTVQARSSSSASVPAGRHRTHQDRAILRMIAHLFIAIPHLYVMFEQLDTAALERIFPLLARCIDNPEMHKYGLQVLSQALQLLRKTECTEQAALPHYRTWLDDIKRGASAAGSWRVIEQQAFVALVNYRLSR